MVDLDFEALPSTWTTAPITEVAQCKMGTTILAKDLTETGTPVYSAGTDNRPWGFLTDPDRVFGPETVVLSARGTIGAAKIPAESVFTSTQTTITASFPSPSLARWAQPYLRTVDWKNRQAGNAIPMLTIGMLSEVLLPLAPEAEQRRIVAKLDALQSRTRLAREALAAIPTLLGHYRQSVLRAAFTGLLSETGNAERRIIPSGAHPFIDGDLDLPRNWDVASIGDACAKVQDGNYGGDYPKENEWIARGIPFLTGAALGDTGDILWHKLRYITNAKHQQLQKAQIRQGDVVFPNRGARDSQLNGSAQMSYLIGPELSDANINPQLTLLRPSSLVLPAYLKHFLDSILFLSQHKMATGGSALAFINLEKTRQIAIPLPPTAEQTVIVSNIERLMGKISSLYSITSNTTQAISYLDQSLLATAFRGELVPQDPTDEPASVLLDRIRAARETNRNDATTRRKTARSSPVASSCRRGEPSRSPVASSHRRGEPSPDAYATLLAALRKAGSLANADAQTATGLDAATVRPLLQRLVAEGHARVEGQKRGTRYVRT